MQWKEIEIPKDEHGEPTHKGILELRNDKNEPLGSVQWFYDEGPFYTHAMDVNDVKLIRRIGPIGTLEKAKRRVEEAIEGKGMNLEGRAAYERN